MGTNRSKKKHKDKESKKINIKQTVFSTVLSLIAGALLAAGTGYFSFREEMRESMAETKAKLEDLDRILSDIESDNEKDIRDLDSSIGGLNDRVIEIGERVSVLEGKIDPVNTLQVTQEFAQNLLVDPMSLVFLGNEKIRLDSPLAYSREENRTISANELANHKTILTYIDGNNSVIFSGQCIINVYDMYNRLIRILDGDYYQGHLINYRQVLMNESKDGDIWLVSDRIVGESSNHGSTWKYLRDEYITLNNDLSSVSDEDIYTVDKFVQNMNIILVEYYKGDTSNLYYNDQSGDSYLVKYFTENQNEDKFYVKTLYVGGFLEGQFDDHSGNAWYIVKEYDTDYMYYKGGFTAGNPDNHEVEIPLSELRIGEIIKASGVELECPMDWDI